MAPLLEDNRLAMLEKNLDSDMNGMSSIETTAMVTGVFTSFVAITALLVIVFVCGCCGGRGEEQKAEEAQRKASQKKSEPVKKSVPKMLILKPDEVKEHSAVQMIPHVNRQMPAPKHKVPLAPPGHTLPPAYMPDDDDKTVQTPMNKSQVTGSSKKG